MSGLLEWTVSNWLLLGGAIIVLLAVIGAIMSGKGRLSAGIGGTWLFAPDLRHDHDGDGDGGEDGGGGGD